MSQILFDPSRHYLCLNIYYWYNKLESKLWREITTFLFFVSHEKSIWEMVFSFPNLVGCRWEGLLRVRVVWLLTINGSRMFLWFDNLVVSLSLCVCACACVFYLNYFTLSYWNSCYVVGIAYIHQL